MHCPAIPHLTPTFACSYSALCTHKAEKNIGCHTVLEWAPWQLAYREVPLEPMAYAPIDRTIRRRRKRDPKGTRERLVRAALELFTTQGYHASTTTQIATRAGIAEGTIYRHGWQFGW